MRQSFPGPAAEAGRPRRTRQPGWWYPFIFVAGFLVIFVANGVMVAVALTTFTGFETERHYEKGLAYNETLAAVREMEALGWQSAVAVSERMHPRPGPERLVELEARFSDRDGRALPELAVEAVLVRPTQAGHDVRQTLTHRGEGRYGAEIELAMPGQWELRLVAQRGAEAWQSSQRIHLR